VRVDADLDVGAELEVREIVLVDVDGRAQLGRIRHDERGHVGLDELAEHGIAPDDDAIHRRDEREPTTAGDSRGGRTGARAHGREPGARRGELGLGANGLALGDFGLARGGEVLLEQRALTLAVVFGDLGGGSRGGERRLRGGHVRHEQVGEDVALLDALTDAEVDAGDPAVGDGADLGVVVVVVVERTDDVEGVVLRGATGDVDLDAQTLERLRVELDGLRAADLRLGGHRFARGLALATHDAEGARNHCTRENQCACELRHDHGQSPETAARSAYARQALSSRSNRRDFARASSRRARSTCSRSILPRLYDSNEASTAFSPAGMP